MPRICLVLCLLLIPMGPYAHAGQAVAVLDAGSPAQGHWVQRDLETLRILMAALAKDSHLDLVADEQVNAFYSEPPDSQAGPLAEQAAEQLKSGRAFSTRLKPTQAITEFKAAMRNLRAVFPHLPDLTALEEAHLQLGMTYQALGQDTESGREYRMVLLLNPERKLDEALVNPVVVERFEQVRRDLVSSLRGSVSLLSTPGGGRVLMDGRSVGRTPITIPGVLPGEHYFSIHAPGYKTWFAVLSVPPGGVAREEVFLSEGQAMARVRLLRSAGAGQSDAAQQLAAGIGADALVMVSFSHPGDQTMLKLSAWRSGQPVAILGIFAAQEGQIEDLAVKLARWLNGDRKAFARSVVALNPDPTAPPSPPGSDPSAGAFYERWWFWTVVGVVVVGAAAATATALMLDGESGVRVDVYR